jgi:hypothetical protein
MNNQTGRTRNSPKGGRLCLSYQEEIDAPAEKVFPLICPVAEYDWIENWDCVMIFLKSGRNEEGCIFTEQITGPVIFGAPVPATWVTNRYDPENHHIQFVIFARDSAVIRYDFRLKRLGKAKTCAEMDFEFTAMSKEVITPDEEAIREKLLVTITFISKSLKHYCETGEMLKAD